MLQDETEAILSLWHGDSDSCGYHHAELVIRACAIERPTSTLAALAIFYPGVGPADIDIDDRMLIDQAFRLYTARKELAQRVREGRVKRTFRRKAA